MERPHLFKLGDNYKITKVHSQIFILNLLLLNYWANFIMYKILKLCVQSSVKNALKDFGKITVSWYFVLVKNM